MSEETETETENSLAPDDIDLIDGILGLPENCRLPEAEEIVSRMREFSPDDPLLIDATYVEYLGSPCVLALASLIATRSDACATTKVQSPSDNFIEAFRDLGLFQDLMKLEFC